MTINSRENIAELSGAGFFFFFYKLQDALLMCSQ